MLRPETENINLKEKLLSLSLNYNLGLKASAINISERVAGVRAKNGQN